MEQRAEPERVRALDRSVAEQVLELVPTSARSSATCTAGRHQADVAHWGFRAARPNR